MSMLQMETTTFIPDDKPQRSNEPVQEGKYKAEVVKVTRKHSDKVIQSRNEDGVNHVADMLEVEYKITDDNASEARRHVWSSPIWIWKDTEHIKSIGLDTLLHVPNQSNNVRYMKFLEVGGYEIEESIVEQKDSKGNVQKRKAYTLPVEIDLDLAIGRQCFIEVKHQKWTDKEGNQRVTAKEMLLFPIDDQPVATNTNGTVNPEDDDLPF